MLASLPALCFSLLLYLLCAPLTSATSLPLNAADILPSLPLPAAPSLLSLAPLAPAPLVPLAPLAPRRTLLGRIYAPQPQLAEREHPPADPAAALAAAGVMQVRGTATEPAGTVGRAARFQVRVARARARARALALAGGQKGEEEEAK